MTKDNILQTTASQASRLDARRLHDGNERSLMRKQLDQPEQQVGEPVERDWGAPSSLEQAIVWRRELVLRRSGIELELSGYKRDGPRGTKIQEKRHPQRKKLVGELREVIERRGLLDGFLQKARQPELSEIPEGDRDYGRPPDLATAKLWRSELGERGDTSGNKSRLAGYFKRYHKLSVSIRKRRLPDHPLIRGDERLLAEAQEYVGMREWVFGSPGKRDEHELAMLDEARDALLHKASIEKQNQ
ncbi:hypothetical protein ACFL2C_04350 [Patescibacteria group bacterium]